MTWNIDDLKLIHFADQVMTTKPPLFDFEKVKAEEIAERVGVISNGELLLVEKKDELMESLGKKQLIIDLKEPVKKIPSSLKNYNIELSEDGMQISYTYVVKDEEVDVSEVLHEITNSGLLLKDLKVEQSSLEDIFVDLVKEES